MVRKTSQKVPFVFIALFLVGMAIPALAQPQVIAHWSFDQINGSNQFEDNSGNGYHATIAIPDTVTGSELTRDTADKVFGAGSGNFNRANETDQNNGTAEDGDPATDPGSYAAAPHVVEDAFYSGSHTVAVWLKVSTQTSWCGVVGDWTDNAPQSGRAYLYGTTGDTAGADAEKPMLTVTSSSGANGPINFNAGGTAAFTKDVWHHVAWVVDRVADDTSELTIYVDGEVYKQATWVSSAGTDIRNNDMNPTWIGLKEDNGLDFHGKMDELFIFDAALTIDEIATLMTKNALLTNKAQNPMPANGATLVAVDTDLSWDAPDDPNDETVTYDVYFGTTVPDANCDGPALVSSDQAATTHDPGTLAFETTYYWRVDVIDPNGGGNPIVVKGDCWSFTTAPDLPVITHDPDPLTVEKGATAMFSITQVNATGFQWKKDGVDLSDGGKISGATTDTLTITDVQVTEEGNYSVVVTNDSGSDTSTEAQLITCRLVGHWKLDGDLTDSVQDVEPDAPAFDGSVVGSADGPAAFDTGIDGNAYSFTGDPNANVIEMLGTEDYYNFFTRGFSISAWVNVAANPGHEAGIASKQNEASTENDGFSFYTDQPNGEAEIDLNPVSTRDTDVAVIDGAWHHVVAVYDADAGTLTTYLDGEDPHQNTSVAAPTASPGAPLVFGAQDNGGTNSIAEAQMTGLLDDVRIYSCSLKPTEVATLYTDFVDATICVFDNPEDDLAGFDFNDDCTVNLLDFALLADRFLDCNLIPVSACGF